MPLFVCAFLCLAAASWAYNCCLLLLSHLSETYYFIRTTGESRHDDGTVADGGTVAGGGSGGGGAGGAPASTAVGYTPELFAALVQRFEMPDSRSRWDKPLFVVEPTEDLPLTAITEVLLGKANGARNMATTSQPLASSSLHDVDRITQRVVTEILKQQTNAMEGDKLIIEGHKEGLVLTRQVAMSELRRIRRQFTTYNKSHPIEDPARVVPVFVSFVQSHLQ